MNHSDGPHSKKNGEAKTRDSKQINHKIAPERLSEPHLSEYAERRNKQRNNDTKNITASTGFEQRQYMVNLRLLRFTIIIDCFITRYACKVKPNKLIQSNSID